MTVNRITVEITFAWWYRPYLACLIAFATMVGREPDREKLLRVIRSAMRMRVLEEPIDASEAPGGTTPCC